MGEAFSQTVPIQGYVDSLVDRELLISSVQERLTRLAEEYRSKHSIFPSQPEIDVEFGAGAIFNDPDRQLKLGIRQEIDIYGKSRDLKQKSLLEIQQAKYGIAIVRIDYTALLYSMINQLASAEALQTLSDSLFQSAEILFNNADRRKKNGDISALEYNAIYIEYTLSKINHMKKQSELLSIKSQFVAKFKTIPPGESNRLIASFRFSNLDTAMVESRLDSIPALASLRLEREILQTEKELARRDVVTNPSFGISFTQSRIQFSRDDIYGSAPPIQGIDYIRKDEKELGFQLSFALPFSIPYLWETPKFITMSYDPEIIVKETEYEQMRRSLSATVRSLLQRKIFLDTALDKIQAVVTVASTNYHNFERAYLVGELSYSDFLSNRRALSEVYQSEIELRQELYQTQIDLQAIFGQ